MHWDVYGIGLSDGDAHPYCAVLMIFFVLCVGRCFCVWNCVWDYNKKARFPSHPHLCDWKGLNKEMSVHLSKTLLMIATPWYILLNIEENYNFWGVLKCLAPGHWQLIFWILWVVGWSLHVSGLFWRIPQILNWIENLGSLQAGSALWSLCHESYVIKP